LELWDLIDENREPLNRTHIRGEKMTLGEFHTVVCVWTANSKGEVLLTLRDPNKDEYPGKWENTAGSAIAGEGSRAGAVRELWEETGIRASESELIFLGTRKEKYQFADTYLVHRDLPIEELTLLEGETVDAQWVTIEKLDEMTAKGLMAKPVVERLKEFREEFEKQVLDGKR
jgi:8-oxo-dGTP pyrophosphatase MutT (NUDIX family)